MRSLGALLLALVWLLGAASAAAEDVEAGTVAAEDAPASTEDPTTAESPGEEGSESEAQREVMGSGLEDPQSLLPEIAERRKEQDSLLPVSPLFWLHDLTDRGKKAVYDATAIELGADLTHLFQGYSESHDHQEPWGTATTSNLAASWKVLARDEPHRGMIFAHGQARWDYGKDGPEVLGAENLGSAIGTANTFSKYSSSPVLLRNLYWQQGSAEAGWTYRIGKITPDAMMSSSKHLNASTTFMPNTSIGSFTSAHADSGLGIAATWFPTERLRLLALVSDANGNRENFGRMDEGDFYKTVELGVKLFPRTPRAGYSKLTFWHTDGTYNGKPVNANTGEDGWGFFVKLEQELTADGRAIGIVRYGRSFNSSAVYEQLGTLHLLYYNPSFLKWIRNDVLGIGFTWTEIPPSGARDEYNLEVFYRLPVFPSVDMTLSYQSVFESTLDRSIDHGSAYSVRLRTTF